MHRHTYCQNMSFSPENIPNFLPFSSLSYLIFQNTLFTNPSMEVAPLFHSRNSSGHLLFLISTCFFHKFKTSSWSRLNISTLCNLFCYFNSTQSIMQLLELSLTASFISFLLVLCNMLPSPSNKFLQQWSLISFLSPVIFSFQENTPEATSNCFATQTAQRSSCLL